MGPGSGSTGILAEALALLVLAGAPLLLGAAHTATLLGLSFCSLAALAAALLSAKGTGGLRVGWLSYAALALAALPALQLVPLPPALHRPISGELAAIFATSLEPFGLYPAWRPLTLDVPATARELVRAVSLTATIVVLQHCAATRSGSRERALRTLAASAAVVALLGFAHAFLGADALFGLWTPRVVPPLLTPFGNANHAAAWLNLGALMALGLALGATSPAPRLGWATASALCFAASPFMGSRGGFVALGVGLVVLLVANHLRRNRDRRVSRTSRLLPWGVVVAAAAAAVFFGDAHHHASRTLAELAESPDGKLVPVRAALAALPHFPWLGMGAGAFETAHPRYLDVTPVFAWTHVENEALQALVELGLPAGLLLLGVVSLATFALLRRGRSSAREAGAAAAATALAVHSFADFNLHLAAGWGLAALLAVRPDPARLLRPKAAVPLATAMLLVAVVGARHAWPDLRRDSEALAPLAADATVPLAQVERAARIALAKRPADYLPLEVAAARAVLAGEDSRALALSRAMQALNPRSGRAHRIAGHALAGLGRRGESLREFFLAASAGEPTVEDVLARHGDREAVLAAVPAEPGAIVEAAERLARRGRDVEALLLLERLGPAAGSPGFAPVNRRAALLHHRLLLAGGRAEEALALIRRFRSGAPQVEEDELCVVEARTLRALGRRDEARGLLGEVLARDPGNAEAAVDAARLALEAGEPGNALQLLSRARPAADAGLRAEYHRVKGRAHLASGERRRARDDLALALELSPGREDTRISLVEALIGLRDFAAAERELLAFAEDSPHRLRLAGVLQRARNAQGAPDLRPLVERAEAP